jgi:acetylornithine deacetylase/succinyl-diaminopimelate desuccinylase-like protein
LETPSVHASIIKGGEELSSYPAECTIAIERRTVPGETPEGVRAELVAILDEVAATTKDFSYELGGGFTRAPLQVSEDHEIVRSIQKHFQTHTGNPIGFRGEWYWTDAALMNDAGITTVLFGVDGEGAHAATEWATERGQGRGRTGDLSSFSRTLVPTELPGHAKSINIKDENRPCSDPDGTRTRDLRRDRAAR